MNNLQWLEDWYSENCNGDWEHSYGIEISTLDNPGWNIKIDLKHTKWESFGHQDRMLECGEDNWIHVKKDVDCIIAACSPLNLDNTLGIIREWIEANKEVN